MATRIIRLHRTLTPTTNARRYDIHYNGRHAVYWQWIGENGAVYIRFQGRTYTRRPSSPKRDRATYFRGTRKIRGRTVNLYLHREIYQFFIGPIPRGFLVHHVNFDPLDSHPRNLALLTRAEHVTLHNRERQRSLASRCKTGRSVTLGYLRRQLVQVPARQLLELLLGHESVVDALIRIGSRRLTRAIRRIVR